MADLTRERQIRKKFDLKEGNFLSTEDVAKILSVKEEVVRDLIRRRELPAVKIGKAYRIIEIDLQVFLNERYTPHMKKGSPKDPAPEDDDT
ncbi:MAG: helix-turn-helix domain-containing protein [Methanospirillum hungatei]|nr:helix-turn-helix domain-containing protein [Methanospirillum hungatei]MCA1915781.1 helix-turn-helix domain-containing protein [Methanospirillum hungatei]